MGGLGTELNLLNTQVRKNSLNIAQIVQSSSDPSRDHFCENLASLLFHSTGKEILLILSNLISKSATYTRPDRSQIEHIEGLKMREMKSLNSK